MISRDAVVDALVAASDASWPTLSREQRDRFEEVATRLHAWISDRDGDVHSDCVAADTVADEDEIRDEAKDDVVSYAINYVLKPLVENGRLDRQLGREIATKLKERPSASRASS